MAKADIVNVVATASLNQTLDFYELRKFKEIFHDSQVYGGRVAYFKTSSMEGRISLFPSGKMISVGTKSEEKAFFELEFAMRFLVEKGIIKEVKLEPKVQNLVVVADLRKIICIEKLAENKQSVYEPEQFPALILRVDKPYKASFLIFTSGKAVITGLKSLDQIKPTLQTLEDIVNSENEKKAYNEV
jgi:TATA-box binding protein (TBP) (component of TFIID and TFIIIB)